MVVVNGIGAFTGTTARRRVRERDLFFLALALGALVFAPRLFTPVRAVDFAIRFEDFPAPAPARLFGFAFFGLTFFFFMTMPPR